MAILKEFGRYIVRGAGFAVGAVIIVVSAIQMEELYNRKPHLAENVDSFIEGYIENPKEIAISSYEYQKNDSGLLITGELSNNGKTIFNRIAVRVRVLNQKGRVIEECKGQELEPVHPGSKGSFIARCNGYKHFEFPVFEKIEPVIAAAWVYGS